MTKEEWAKVQAALTDFYSIVKLEADGYQVTLALRRISEYKNAIVINVNQKCEWFVKDCEERRRFFQRSKRSVLTKKEKEAFRKLSKKRQKQLLDSGHLTYDIYFPYWTTFGAMKKHLIANNQSIELIKID